MRTRPLTLAAVIAAAVVGCQLDPGNFIAFQFEADNRQVALINVVADTHGVTTEHWAFNTRNSYDPARGVDTVPSRSGWTFDEFKQQACAGGVSKYLQVATTEYPLVCSNPVQPTVATPPDAILGDGSFTVTQSGREVGTVFVTGKVEHWGVITGTFNRGAGFSVRPRKALTYATWASYVCSNYNPRTYWVVTSTTARLCP